MAKWGKALCFYFAIVILAGAALLSLTALAMGKTGKLPKETIPVLTTAEGCIAVFLGAFAASAKLREKGMLIGLAGSAVFLLTMLPISILLYHGEFTAAGVVKAAAILLSGSIGGILGVNRKTKVKF